MSIDPHRSDRVGRTAVPRIAVGLVIGPVAGALIGLLVGVLLFDAGTTARMASVIAGAVFGALGGFIGGLSGLGPPAEADDPLPRVRDDDAATPADGTPDELPVERRPPEPR